MKTEVNDVILVNTTELPTDQGNHNIYIYVDGDEIKIVNKYRFGFNTMCVDFLVKDEEALAYLMNGILALRKNFTNFQFRILLEEKGEYLDIVVAS